MDRIIEGAAALLSATFTFDGIATDPIPATATVTITNAQGAVIVATTAATRTAVGTFTYQLTPAQTAQRDVFTAVWVTTNFGTVTTHYEVVGGRWLAPSQQ